MHAALNMNNSIELSDFPSQSEAALTMSLHIHNQLRTADGFTALEVSLQTRENLMQASVRALLTAQYSF